MPFRTLDPFYAFLIVMGFVTSLVGILPIYLLLLAVIALFAFLRWFAARWADTHHAVGCYGPSTKDVQVAISDPIPRRPSRGTTLAASLAAGLAVGPNFGNDVN